jgi:hypothetical protein
MSKLIETKILDLATRFREAADLLCANGVPAGWKAWDTYPRAVCNLASETLGIIIQENLSIELTIEAGCTDDLTNSHSWLRYGEFIIDITADQFGKDKFYFGPETAWYAQWTERTQNELSTDPLFLSENCWPAYTDILQKMNE